MPFATVIFCFLVFISTVFFIGSIMFPKKSNKEIEPEEEPNDYLSDKITKYNSWKQNIHSN